VKDFLRESSALGQWLAAEVGTNSSHPRTGLIAATPALRSAV